ASTGRTASSTGAERKSVEARLDRTRALELEELAEFGDEQDAVPEPAGLLAARDRGDDGAEEGVLAERADRRADLLADQRDAPLVGAAHGLVVLRGIHGGHQLGVETGSGERVADRFVQVVQTPERALVVEAGAELGVERAGDVLAVLGDGGG